MLGMSFPSDLALLRNHRNTQAASRNCLVTKCSQSLTYEKYILFLKVYEMHQQLFVFISEISRRNKNN